MKTTPQRPARRRFLKASAALSGGLVLGFYLPGATRIAAAQTAAANAGKTYPPNAFIRIAKNGRVTILVNKLEFGQGVFTSLPMLIAEELGCAWTSVRAMHAPVAPVYNHPAFGIQMTGGSESVKSSYDQFRAIGARARTMLIAAAAQGWGVDPSACRAELGSVIHTGSGRRATFGSLAEAAGKLPVPEHVALKDPLDFKLLGRPTRRIDAAGKINGEAKFGLDMYLPGMAYAVVARAPGFGGKALSVDAAKARAVRGVLEVVEVPSGVAVIAENSWAALKGRDALSVRWSTGDGPGGALSSEELRRQFRQLAATPGMPARREGDPKAIAKAAKVVNAEYELPYLAHAPMEPLNCVVDLKPGSCRLWAGSQFQTVDHAAAAATAGLKPEQVELITTLAGGGFGRRANPASDYIVEAIHVAKAAGRPVQIFWSREDDLQGGYYRPMFVHRVSAGLDAAGGLLAWNHTLVGQSIIAGTSFEPFMVKDGIDSVSVEGVVDMPYPVPNFAVDLHSPKTGIPVLWWRSVGHSHSAFVVETMIDELAAAAGKDPVAFRRGLLAKHPRELRTLNLAAEKSGWGTPLPPDRARGIAVHQSFESVVAHVVEASIEDGKPRVHRVVSAIDCGFAVNPLTVEAQVQGAIVFGLSAALHGAITFKDGRVEQSNFHDYPVMRMNEMPKVEVHIVPTRERPTGVGEPGTPPIAPALANALFALTGKRIRRLPIAAEDLKA